MVEISKLPPRTGQPSDAFGVQEAAIGDCGFMWILYFSKRRLGIMSFPNAAVQEHLSWLQSGGGQCLRGDGRTW